MPMNRPFVGFSVGDIPLEIRERWCHSNMDSCNTLCNVARYGETQTNACSELSFEYQCMCYNGIRPFMKNYTNTLEGFACQENKKRLCINGTDVTGGHACRTCPSTPPTSLDINEPIMDEFSLAPPPPKLSSPTFLQSSLLLASLALLILWH